MRILVLTDLYPPYFLGGAELCCQNHVEALRARGHEVFILTSQWGIGAPSVEGHVYRRLHYEEARSAAGQGTRGHDRVRLRRRYDQLRRAISLSRNYKLARAVVVATQPDVAYVWQMRRVSIAPVLAAQDLGIPVVIRLPDFWLAELRTELCLEPNPLKRWYRAVLSGLGGFARMDTRHMLAESLALMQSYVQAGFAADSMQVIPEGVPFELLLDVSELNALPLPGQNGDVRLLFAGRLVSSKGPDTAIQALACLMGESCAHHATLDIVGEGTREFESGLRNMVAELGLADRISFVGKLDHPQVLERYARYDGFLFPSRWVEPFGLGVIEAMARGLPVIATNRGGPAEIISDGEDGLLVPPDNPEAMAAAIRMLVADPKLVRKIRCNALATVRARYSSERIAEQVEGCLQAAILQQA